MVIKNYSVWYRVISARYFFVEKKKSWGACFCISTFFQVVL